VLVYKHPGLHFGDIHVFTARYIEDIGDAVGCSRYALLFPTTGPRSSADEMANSDHDGDMFWVSINAQVSCLLVDTMLDFFIKNIVLDGQFKTSRTKVALLFARKKIHFGLTLITLHYIHVLPLILSVAYISHALQ
jgi:hypothetical protein